MIKKKTILDIGCWDGRKVKELLQQGHEAYGCDVISSRFLPEIRDNLCYLDITKEEISKKHPLFHQFDVIYLNDVLEHLDNDEKALENICNLLKRSGILYLTTPRSIPLFEFYDPAWIRWKLGIGKRHYHYPMGELISKIVSNGFCDISIKVTGNFNWLFLRWINLFIKHVLHSKPIQAKKEEGYFNWNAVIKK